ncbi:unnamed protein product [Aureobasidium pullulans]|nr:unnamed protein product [Aureobasidium pullulans]
MAWAHYADYWVVLLFYASKAFSNTLSSPKPSILWSVFYTLVFIGGLYLGGQPEQRWEHAPGWMTLWSLIPSYIHDRHRYWTGWGALLLVWSTSNSPMLQRIFNNRFTQYLGKISFSLYLVHGFMIHTLYYSLLPIVWNIFGSETHLQKEVSFGVALGIVLDDIAEFLIIPVLLELGLVILIAVHAGITMVCHLFAKVFRLDGLVGQLCTPAILTSMRHILSHLITFISIVTKALFDIAVGLCDDLTKDDPPGAQWTHLGRIFTAMMLTAVESKCSVHLVTVRVFILAFWFWTATSWLALFVFGVKWVKCKVVVKDTKSADTDKMLTDLVNCIVMLKDRIVSLENAAAIQEKSIARLLSQDTAIIPDDLSSKKSSDCFDLDSCTEGQLTPATNDDGVLQDCSGAVSDCSEANSVQYTPNSSTTTTSAVIYTPLSVTSVHSHGNIAVSSGVNDTQKRSDSGGSTHSGMPVLTSKTTKTIDELPLATPEVTPSNTETSSLHKIRAESSINARPQTPWDKLTIPVQLALLRWLAPTSPNEPDPFVVPKLLEIRERVHLETVSDDVAKELQAQLKNAKMMGKRRMKEVKSLQSQTMKKLQLCTDDEKGKFVMLDWNVDAYQNIFENLEDAEIEIDEALDFIGKYR